jgi:predicted alpha/beta hydrolase
MQPLEIICADQVRLGGHFWPAKGGGIEAVVVINPATGVLARYYHRYAAYLSGHGFAVLTYDYRGIGASRPATLRGCRYKWRDWGMKDFDAVLKHAAALRPGAPILVVGHSIGGYLPALAPTASLITRLLAVGGQYGYWRDYAPGQRLRLFLKWNLAMPALAALYGYFPGRRLGWLEDLPAGVVWEWAFRRARMEQNHPPEQRGEILARFAAFTAPILAVTLTDDEFATPTALARTLRYYRNAPHQAVQLRPSDLGHERIGHFGLFHARHVRDFWPATLHWLRGGENPWPHRLIKV